MPPPLTGQSPDGPKPHAPTGHRREAGIAAVIALSLAALSFVAGAMQATTTHRRDLAAETTARARDLARSVDMTLRTYAAALDTMAQSTALRSEFDPAAAAEDARLVGRQFGGWFMVATGGVQTDILLDTSLPDATAPRRQQINPPEVRRAEAESLALGHSAVSDAYDSGTTNARIVTIATPINSATPDQVFLYFSVILNDIAASLIHANLAPGDIAVIIDGSRNIIASSASADDVIRSGLQDLASTLPDAGTGIIRIAQPSRLSPGTMVATRNLRVAQNWTLAIARPIPSALSSASDAAWPGLLALSVLIISASIANLVMDRRRTQAEVFRAAREAAEREELLNKVKASDERKARLMAVLAHDLRTPLVAMLGSLDVYRVAHDSTSRARVVDRMQRDGHGMLQLIDDVLELARLGAGEVRLRPEPLAPARLLKDVAKMIRPQAARRGTSVVTDIGAVPPLVMGDLAALRRVLLNFATNAVKATQDGQITLSVTAIAGPPGNSDITFAVSDTGVGIATEDLPKLFRDFGMLERDGDTREGTGLGLAICRRLAAEMGGHVGADSTKGQGSRFWLRLTLPVAQDHVPPEPATPEDDPARALKGLRVLVAEDHDTIRHLTCNSLARSGAHPTEAVDGLDAVALAEAQAFDLILLDQNMPNLDGTAAAARIRQGKGPSSGARIICVSAHQTTAIAAMLSDLSLDGFLTKPITLSKLGALVQAPTPTSPDSEAMADFDPEILHQLHDVDDGALLRRSLHRLAEEIETTKTDLNGLIAAQDLIAARRLAHKLAGFCDVLGARSLSRAMRRFEHAIETAPPDARATLLAEVSGEMDRTRTATLHRAQGAQGAVDTAT